MTAYLRASTVMMIHHYVYKSSFGAKNDHRIVEV